MKKVLVTGAAGFIGFHLCKKLAERGYAVTGLDNINDYYDTSLKYARLAELGIPENKIAYNKPVTGHNDICFYKIALEDKDAMQALFKEQGFYCVINLGGQAGVRYSLENPYSYVESNVMGFLNILEGCRHNGVSHLIYASSSSVYGLNSKIPFAVDHGADHPVSLYAATKKSNELMAHSYSHLYNIPSSGLRFFTVYGPWGRPDMAPFIFTKKIMAGEAIQVFNNGDMERDFTYVDDITENIALLIPQVPVAKALDKDAYLNPSISSAPYRLYNIGNNAPVKLADFIKAIEKATGKEAKIDFKPMQPGDVKTTFADVNSLIEVTGFKPCTDIQTGMNAFVNWYRSFYEL